MILACRLASPEPYPGHIYMEVDPLYCREGPASSSSSQTSSGYSTAPSDHLRSRRCEEEVAGPEQGVYSVSHLAGELQQGQHAIQQHQHQTEYVRPQHF